MLYNLTIMLSIGNFSIYSIILTVSTKHTRKSCFHFVVGPLFSSIAYIIFSLSSFSFQPPFFPPSVICAIFHFSCLWPICQRAYRFRPAASRELNFGTPSNDALSFPFRPPSAGRFWRCRDEAANKLLNFFLYISPYPQTLRFFRSGPNDNKGQSQRKKKQSGCMKVMQSIGHFDPGHTNRGNGKVMTAAWLVVGSLGSHLCNRVECLGYCWQVNFYQTFS